MVAVITVKGGVGVRWGDCILGMGEGVPMDMDIRRSIREVGVGVEGLMIVLVRAIARIVMMIRGGGIRFGREGRKEGRGGWMGR